MSLQLGGQPQTAYPVLDTTIPYIAPRSRFYPLSPIGLGTPFVESLSSYMCRLATAHFLSFGSLYEYMLVPNLNKTYLTTPSHLSPGSTLVGSFRNRSKGINGTGKIAREWLELIETLTLRRDLRSLTLTTLANLLPHWELLRTFQAWCPVCYEEMYQTKQIIYQPLIWTIAAVDICARHRRRLIDRCPHCHRQLLVLTRRVEFGYCSRCGYWMGEQFDNQAIKGNWLPEVELDWQLFVASNVGELLSALPDMDSPIPKERIVGTLHVCVARSTNGVLTQFAKLLDKPLMTVYGWYKGEVRPPLSDLLRICYCLNISILDFVKGPDALGKKRLVVRELANVAKAVRVPRHPKPFNRSKVKVELEKFLVIMPPISAAEAAKRMGCNHRDLYREFPELCRKISSRYRDHLQNHYKTERAKREEEVREAVIHLYAKGIYVSPRPVAEYLKKPSYLGRRDVAIVIRETREKLDSERIDSQMLSWR